MRGFELADFLDCCFCFPMVSPPPASDSIPDCKQPVLEGARERERGGSHHRAEPLCVDISVAPEQQRMSNKPRPPKPNPKSSEAPNPLKLYSQTPNPETRTTP